MKTPLHTRMVPGPIALLLVWMLLTGNSFAHSPHDVIFDVELSPAFSLDRTAYIITSNSLMFSEDEGYSWTKLTNGLDYASQLTSISISPSYESDDTVIVTSENDGIYLSSNRGRSWIKANTGLPGRNIRMIRFSSVYGRTKIAFALDAEGRLFRSSDSRFSWETVAWPLDGMATSIDTVVIEGLEYILVGSDLGQLSYCRVDGENWETISMPGEGAAITCIAPSPLFDTDKTVWVGSSGSGVFQVQLQTRAVESLEKGFEDKRITSLFTGLDTKGQTSVYASTWTQALFRLNIEDRRWVWFGQGLTTDPQAADPYFQLPDFKGVDGQGETLFLGGYDGLFKSLNGGKEWFQLDTILLSGVTGLAVHAQSGKESHSVALATYGAGAYLYDSVTEKWKILNQGLHWPRLNDIAISPEYGNDGLLFSGSENNFLWFDDSTQAWQRVPVEVRLKRRILTRVNYYLRKLGVGASWRNRLITPWSSDTRFPSAIGVSPSFSKDEALLFGTRSSGLYASEDTGQNNRYLWEANNQLITAIGYSPDFANDATIFTGIYNTGLFKSSDGGDSWIKVDEGIPAHKQTILSISPNYADDRTVFAGNANGLYLTSDGGNTWKSIPLDGLGDTPNIICIDFSPNFTNDKMILFGVYGRGLWVTTDFGETIHPIGQVLIENNFQIKFIRFSPNFAQDHLIYCASAYEVFRSSDRGLSWYRMPRPLRYENIREEIKYGGDWEKVSGQAYSAMSASQTQTRGSRMQLRFHGSGFTWLGARSPSHGSANVRIDGTLVATVNQRGSAEQEGVETYTLDGLDAGSHILDIELICPEDNSSCGPISIDAIDIKPGVDRPQQVLQ